MVELSRMKGLRSVDFYYSTFDHSSLGYLADLPKLENLSIRTHGEITWTAFQGVGRLTRLRSLCVYMHDGPFFGGIVHRPTLRDEIAELAGLTELRNLEVLCGSITGASLDTLLRFTKLECLAAESELTDDEVIRLANGLKPDTFVLRSSKVIDPCRICTEVTTQTLYFESVVWGRPGYVITSIKPRYWPPDPARYPSTYPASCPCTPDDEVDLSEPLRPIPL